MKLITIINNIVDNISIPNMGYIAKLGELLVNDDVIVGPGYKYLGGLNFEAPTLPSVPKHITQLAFLTRFTDAEAIALDLASIGATASAAGIRRYINKVNAAKFIDLDRADTRAGVQALETIGILAAGRATIILDSPVTDSERP